MKKEDRIREHFAEYRRKRWRKKPRAPGSPASVGPGKGCGTGSGGFKAGNNCAKEDGIPNKPLHAGGALKKSNPTQDKALYAQAKLSRDKNARINALRKDAAARKAAKGQRDAEEKKAAADAAAAKKAAMLQKIRISKANQRLAIVEKPPGLFSGQIDSTITKNAGETQVEFAKRRIKADLDALHAALDKSEADFRAEDARLVSVQNDLAAKFLVARDARTALAKKMTAPEYKPNKRDTETYESLKKAEENLRAKREEAFKQRQSLEAREAEAHHNIVSEFVKTHGGGLSSFDAKAQFHEPQKLAKTTSKFADAFKANAEKAWAFLSKVAAPLHQAKGSAVKVQLDTSAGDADYHERTEIARHGTLGQTGAYCTSARVIVHEIAHGLHYGPKLKITPVDPKTATQEELLRALEETKAHRESPAMKAREAIKEDYDQRRAEFTARQNGNVEEVSYHKDRAKYKLIVPKGSPRQRDSYLGYADQYCDAENGNETGATEVVSVGVEQMFASPKQFRLHTRSHYDLTLLFLAGRIH